MQQDNMIAAEPIRPSLGSKAIDTLKLQLDLITLALLREADRRARDVDKL